MARFEYRTPDALMRAFAQTYPDALPVAFEPLFQDFVISCEALEMCSASTASAALGALCAPIALPPASPVVEVASPTPAPAPVVIEVLAEVIDIAPPAPVVEVAPPAPRVRKAKTETIAPVPAPVVEETLPELPAGFQPGFAF